MLLDPREIFDLKDIVGLSEAPVSRCLIAAYCGSLRVWTLDGAPEEDGR
jgi:hypothetical protein